MSQEELIPHLFRTEYSKIVSVLCKTFGFSHIEHAEDIASDTFLKAAETWGLKGTPKSPKAWLYQVAKNKAFDVFRHEKVFQQKVRPTLARGDTIYKEVDIDLSENNIKDSQLQMLFAICNPILSSEAQIALALRVLCGFGIDEIARAFLSNKQTINKRLQRAKEKLRTEEIDLKIPDTKVLENRLNNVLSILYLLYNEGYYSTSFEKKVRKELCIEAMRLTYLLLDHEPTARPQTNALMALFCFHASRFESRTDVDGNQIVYAEQDKTQWNQDLIAKGQVYLSSSGDGLQVTEYHLEAIIAFYHTQEKDTKEKWEQILLLYNQLLQLKYSPIIALNRTYALYKANGKKIALREALKIDLKGNHLYHLLLAELYSDMDTKKRIQHLNTALELVTTENEKKLILNKLNKAEQNGI